MKYANLHLHSTYSDSQLTPCQLVLIGKSLGYRALALTDHWTDAGCDVFSKKAASEGLDALTGIELDNSELGASIHITALDYDVNNPRIRALIDNQREARVETTRKCFERGVQIGAIEGISWDDVLNFCDEGSWICIDHVVRAMRFKKIMPEVGGEGALRAKVFNAPEARAFSPKKPPMAEIIGAIRAADGIAVMAHPYKQLQYLPELIEMGLNGIEVSHPDLLGSASHLACAAADEYKLYRSGGTDHTGAMSGCGGNYAIPALQGITEEEYEIIKERRLG